MKKKIIASAAIVAALAAIAAAYFLVMPYLFAPKIVGELRVISYAPQGSAVPVSADGIAVMFNRAVVPLSTLTGGRQRALPLSITPSLPGEFSWLGTSGFIFRPEEPLKAATTYRVELPAGVVSVDGYRLGEPLSWEFSTVAPRLLTMEPGDGENLLPRDAKLFFRFNIVMDEADVEKKIRITDESTGAEISVPRDYSWGDDGHALAVRFKGELPWSAGIKVELPRGLKARAGNIGTERDVVFVYRTPDRKARVEKVTAVDMDDVGEEGPVEVELSSKKEKSLSAGSGICYLFTQPVTKKSFERAFRIEPAKGEVGTPAGAKRAQPYYYFADYEGYSFADAGGRDKPVEGYRRGCASFLDDFDRSYSFSVDPSKLEFLSGASLEGGGEPYAVKTKGARPAIKSLLTKNILSSAGPMRIPYRATNVSDVTVRLYRVTDPWNYDENVKSVTAWPSDPKDGELFTQAIGSSGLKVPVSRRTMAIDASQMPPDIEQKVPVDFRENVSTRFMVDLSLFGTKPSQGIWLVEAVPTPSTEMPKGEPLGAVYSMIEISSVGLAMKREVDHLIAWATDMETGEPLAGLGVKIHLAKWNSEKGALEKKEEAQGVTGSDGVSVMANPGGEDLKACAELSGPDRFAWSCEDDHRLTGYADALRPGPDFYAYVYTDRPIYRPGQKVHFSSFVREVKEGRYFMPDPKIAVEVTARDSSGAEIFKEAKAQVSPGGMVSGEFDLPQGDGAPRGAYTLVVGFGEQAFTKAFMVTSYRKPSFKVDVTTPSAEIVSKEEMRAEASGQYFFGSPMKKAAASWSIMTSTYVFAPEGYAEFSFVDDDLLYRRVGAEGEVEYASDFEFDILASQGFGAETYAEDAGQYDDPRNQGGGGGGMGGSFFKGASEGDARFVPARLGDDGKLSISYVPDLKKYPTSQILSVDVDVTDPSMQQVSASKDVVVHKADFYLGLKPRRWVWGEKEKAEVDAVVLDTAGKPAAGKSFAVEVLRREYKFIEKRNAAGFWDFVYTPKDTKVATLKAKSDASGAAALSFTIPQGGEYRFVAKGQDGRGNEIQSAVAVYAWGEGFVPWRMDRPEELELVPDKEAYRIGDTAKILVKSLMPVTKALVTYERGRVLEYKVSEQGGNATHIEIPIEQGMIPNFFLSVVAHAGRDGERPPLIFYGETAINVEPDAKRLTVSVEADRKGRGETPPVYRPGEKVTVKVKTAGPDGKPMPAHVIVSVADESVLRFLGYELPDLVKKFYYRRPSGVMTSSSMVSLKAGDAGKAGKKRRVFKDTAHFVADLATGKDGEASFSFALPDDLTTWVIEALAATEPRTRAAFEEEKKAALEKTPEGQRALGANLALSDGNFVGGARGKIMTTLPLVLRAALPRFAAWGDRLVGRVIANNRGDAPVSGEIAVIASGSAALKGGDSPKRISMEIPAGEESSYPVEIDVTSGGDRFAFSAQARSKSGEDLDGLEISVPVKDRFSPEVVATSGMTEGTEEQAIDLPGDVEESLGGLGIRLRAALALAAAPGLKALIDFPYGCSEQKSASLAALLMAREMTEALGEAWFDSLAPVSREASAGLSSLDEKKGYLDERIKALLSELVENFMNYDGGLRYWPESSGASYFATVQSLWAMTRAKAQGFAVDEAAMGRMRGYVRKGVVPPRREGVRELSLDEKAFGLWALSLGGAVEAGVGDELPGRMEEMSVTGASYLLMAMKNLGRKTEASKAAAFVLSQARQEPRHTSWPASKFLWSSALKNTALAATALFSNDPSDPNVPRALAFVLNRKRADRGEGTQDNLYAAWLVADFAKAKGEGKADFKASVASGEESFAEAAFDEKNILADVLKDIPMKELSRLDMPAKISIGKRGEGTLYYDMVLKYYLPPDETPTREEGIIVSREYYALNDAAERKPLKEFKAGENYRGHITVIAPQELNYVVVEERLPAGFEPVDVTLATSSRAAAVAAGEVPANLEPVSYWDERSMSYDDVVRLDDFGMSWNFRHQEIRDDAIIWSDEIVPAGVYHIRYPVRATTAGEYLMPGTTAFEFYEPEIFGRSMGREIKIKE